MSTDDEQFRAFADHVHTDLLPMLEASAMTVSICPVADRVDVKFAVELGLSIMLDKPIIVAVPPGRVVPERLVRVADEIVELTDMDADTTARIGEAILRVGHRLTDEHR